MQDIAKPINKLLVSSCLHNITLHSQPSSDNKNFASIHWNDQGFTVHWDSIDGKEDVQARFRLQNYQLIREQ